MVVTIGTLISAHDLAFRVYATSKAADSAGKIDRTEDADVSRRPTMLARIRKRGFLIERRPKDAVASLDGGGEAVYRARSRR